MRLTGFLATCSIALAFLAGCGDSGSGSGKGATTGASTVPGQSTANGRTQIAVIAGGTGDYWKALHAGAEKARSETARHPGDKPTVDILWRDSVNRDDGQAQIRLVEDLMGLQVAAIIVVPGDSETLKDVVERAAGKHIPIIIMDAPLNSDQPRAYVGTDDKHGGDLAGQCLSKILGAKGKVIILHAPPGRTSAADRESGFREAMKDDEGLQIVATDRDGGSTSDTAYSAAKRLLTPYRNADGTLTIDGIFTPTETTTQGMLRALQEFKLAGKVKFVGYGSAGELLKALENGEIDGLAMTRPMNTGYLAVKTAIRAIKEDKTLLKRNDSGTFIVTKQNLASPETQEILHPEVDKWLK